MVVVVIVASVVWGFWVFGFWGFWVVGLLVCWLFGCLVVWLVYVVCLFVLLLVLLLLLFWMLLSDRCVWPQALRKNWQAESFPGGLTLVQGQKKPTFAESINEKRHDAFTCTRLLTFHGSTPSPHAHPVNVQILPHAVMPSSLAFVKMGSEFVCDRWHVVYPRGQVLMDHLKKTQNNVLGVHCTSTRAKIFVSASPRNLWRVRPLCRHSAACLKHVLKLEHLDENRLPHQRALSTQFASLYFHA